MGLFGDDDFLTSGIGGILTGGTVFKKGLGYVSGADDAKKRQQELEAQQAAERARIRETQLGLLGQIKGPQVDPAIERRIKALEMESTPTALVEDPLFQGDRATLVQGGQQALASAQNSQRAYGLSGGFQNTGSVQDAYDRLGGQLSALGQQSRQVKETKRDTAAAARQSLLDAQVSYDNAMIQARMNIEAGDSAAASAAIQQAYQARESIAASQRAMLGAVLGTAASVGGMIAGGPAGGAAGNSIGQSVGGGGAYQAPQEQVPTQSAPQTQYSLSSRPYTYFKQGPRY